jgi:hypothetical protein
MVGAARLGALAEVRAPGAAEAAESDGPPRAGDLARVISRGRRVLAFRRAIGPGLTPEVGGTIKSVIDQIGPLPRRAERGRCVQDQATSTAGAANWAL